MERGFASCASFLWLIIVSVTINLFNTWLAQLRDANFDQVTQHILLRKYLEEHDVSRSLTYKVLRCFRAKYHMHMRRVHEEDIEFLRDLPMPLKVSLHREVYLPILRPHPFFKLLASVNESLLSLVSHIAIGEHHHLAGETVFLEGEVATEMLRVGIGQLDYYLLQRSVGCMPLSPGDWACEAALWVRWTLRGRLVAATSSELVGIDVAKFHAVMQDADWRGQNIEAVRHFARGMLAHLSQPGAVQGDLDLYERLVEEAMDA